MSEPITFQKNRRERYIVRDDVVWPENLNLRGSYKQMILDYIAEKHPDLMPLG